MNTFGRMAQRDAFIDIRNLVVDDSPMIVDGGANQGSTIDLFLSLYKKPKIYAFEPIPSLIKYLRECYHAQQNIEIVPCALGDANRQVEFNVTRNLVSSSRLKPAEVKKQYHGLNVQIEDTIQVEMIRLDTWLSDVASIDVLKLDIQGGELDALIGCGQLLKHTKIVYVEVEFIPLYDGQPLFSDIDAFLREHNFKLYNLYDLWTHTDGQLTSGDALYINTRYFQDGNRIDSRYALFSQGFHGDQHLMNLVRHVLNRSSFFIETGSNVGTTLSYVAKEFPNIMCISCEPDNRAYDLACINANQPNVVVYNEESQDFLKRLTREYSNLFYETGVFWLDAHGYGFEWPLQDEIYFITRCYVSGFIFIDDFKVPHLNDFFIYDKYLTYECSFDFIKLSLNPLQRYTIYYPNYTERTSTHHPLVGWGLIMFGNCSDLELPNSLSDKLISHSINNYKTGNNLHDYK